MKPLVIYHGNCADGYGAAWSFHNADPFGYEYHAAVYQNPPPNVEGRDVLLVDFSYKRDVVVGMIEQANRVVLIDHHKTALDDLDDLIRSCALESHCSLDKSGAMLAWEYTHTDGPPGLLRHIEDRDLWRFALPLTREIQACVFSHPYNFEVWDTLMAAGPEELAGMAREGAAIERKHHKDIAELVEVCKRRMEIGGQAVWAASLPYTLTSDAGHLMAKGEPFAACYWDTPQGRVFSLRSTEDGVDVSEIAKKYGGGGHRNASGFRVPFGHELTL